jgi:hypothetical protein
MKQLSYRLVAAEASVLEAQWLMESLELSYKNCN